MADEIIQNNKLNISDYFANKDRMQYITQKYVEFSKYLNVEDINYMPFIYYYFRHKVGAVMYYVDHIIQNVLEKKSFKNNDEDLEDVMRLLKQQTLIPNKVAIPKILFKGHFKGLKDKFF